MTETDEQARAEAASYEDEVSSRRTVTIPLREYDKLKDKSKFITDPTSVSYTHLTLPTILLV